MGKQFLKNPKDIYEVYGNVYLPICAIFHAFTFSLIPFYISFVLWYITNIILGMLFVREYNKILILMNLKDKRYRFLILLIISNGWYILQHFAWNQKKFLAGLLVAYILRREMQHRELKIKNTYKYYFVNYNCILFVLAIAPYFFLLLLAYVFYDIKRKDLFKVANLKKYFLVISLFFAQNFLFIIYPSMIRDFYKETEYFTWGIPVFQHFYLTELCANVFDRDLVPKVNFALNIILIILSTIIICLKRLKIEIKFGYINLFIMFLYQHAWKSLFIIIAFILLIIIPFLKEDKDLLKFFKKNKIALMGAFSLLCINFTPFGDMGIYPFFPGITYFYFIYLSLLIISLIVLNCKKEHNSYSNLTIIKKFNT